MRYESLLINRALVEAQKATSWKQFVRYLDNALSLYFYE